MSLRGLHTFALACAGVLLGHTIGYASANPSRAQHELALGGHEYIGPLAAVVVPAGLIAMLTLAVRSVRRNGQGLPTVRGLISVQVSLYAIQELVERLPGPGSPSDALTQRAVWFGLIAQVVLAWLVVRMVRWTARVVEQVLHGTQLLSSPSPILIVVARSHRDLVSAMVGRLPHRRGPPLSSDRSSPDWSGGALI